MGAAAAFAYFCWFLGAPVALCWLIEAVSPGPNLGNDWFLSLTQRARAALVIVCWVMAPALVVALVVGCLWKLVLGFRELAAGLAELCAEARDRLTTDDTPELSETDRRLARLDPELAADLGIPEAWEDEG